MGTRYRYFTPDGGPPSGGAPPGAPKNPPGFHPWGMPSSGPPPGYCFQHPPSSNTPWVRHPKPPSAPAPTMVCHPTSGPPSASHFYYKSPHSDPSSYMCHPVQNSAPAYPHYVCKSFASAPPPYEDAPPPGARVKGLLATFPDRNSGYIFPKSNCTFHLVKGDKKPWEHPGLILNFKAVHAPTSMKLIEFIEQVGALDHAPAGTPPEYVGVQEIIEGGNGVWHKGTVHLLGDNPFMPESSGHQVEKTLERVGWTSDRGEAGRGKPVILVFLP